MQRKNKEDSSVKIGNFPFITIATARRMIPPESCEIPVIHKGDDFFTIFFTKYAGNDSTNRREKDYYICI